VQNPFAEEAWGERKPFNSVSLHVYMYRLRRKLAPYGLNIETMVNVGYRLLPKNNEEVGRRKDERQAVRA
jgi:DNA-binding response OmpR family regulator